MSNGFILDRLSDPEKRASERNECDLRSYQADALRIIYAGVLRHEGERFPVTFLRQSGKNETQAQPEAAVMAANLHDEPFGTVILLYTMSHEKEDFRFFQ